MTEDQHFQYSISRRDFLAGISAGGVIGLSGCIGPFNSSSSQNPSVTIVDPNDGAKVSDRVLVRVNVQNFNINNSEGENVGHVALSWSGDDISQGDEIPTGTESVHFSKGVRSRRIEFFNSEEYEITAILSRDDNTATQYMDSISVTVEIPYDNIELFVNSNGTESYTVLDVEPERLATRVVPNGEVRDNPDLRLEQGETYRFRLGETGNDHPIEFLDGNGNVLASMARRGEMESSINWSEPGENIVQFNATEEFIDRVDTYSCNNHPNRMSGNII